MNIIVHVLRRHYRRFRNRFFPKEHSQIVKDIKRLQQRLKVVRKRWNEIYTLSRYGLLGDKLLDEQIMLEQILNAHRHEISLLKDKYKYGNEGNYDGRRTNKGDDNHHA